MKPLLRILVLLLGSIVILISLLHVFLGPATIPGSVPVNATMDSEDRFYAVFFLAYGIALIWSGIDLDSRAKHLQLLMIIFFVGGVTRLISMAVAGRPHDFFIAMTVIELVLPVAVILVAREIQPPRTP